MLKKWPSKQLGICHDLYISSDEELFNKILTCPNHILRTHLPPPTAQNYSLRNKPHNRQLPNCISQITDCNFTVRMLYQNMYSFMYFRHALCFIFVYNCGLTVHNKRICYVMLCSFHFDMTCSKPINFKQLIDTRTSAWIGITSSSVTAQSQVNRITTGDL